MEFEIFPEHALIRARPVGRLTAGCMFKYFSKIRADPRWRPGMHRIIDQQLMEDIDITFAEMRNIRANEVPAPADQTHPMVTVFVCVSDISFGMARMYKALETSTRGDPVYIVDTPEEALALLGIPLSETQTIFDT